MIIFIKTHGRPDKQYTYKTLRESGYTGEISFIVDDEDTTIDDLPDDANTRVQIFDKQAFMDITDSGTNSPRRNVNLYAWKACEHIAKVMKCEQYIMADDDITGFRYRYEEDNHLKSLKITKNLDLIFEIILSYMSDSNIAAIGTGIPQMYFSKNIDENLWKYRIVYQFVFRNSKFSMDWVSEYEEDIITSINMAKMGKYVTCLPIIQHDAISLGKSTGGMQDMYTENFNRFLLAEYGHIFNPSCEIMDYYKDKWITNIKRDNAFPKLISSKFQLQPN